MKKIRSRIMEIFDKEILKEMYELQSKRLTWGMVRKQRTKVEYTAKMKVQDMTNILTKYLSTKGYSFSFPGAGTNRMTVLIDGYIYKIALDQDGYIDNLNEFILSKEAQPYVTKTYETNGLIAVAEYVTLISYEEFVEKKSKILEILDDISREYLIGDMGWTQKNYANWGYRKNSDDLVILDFGHMHRLSGEKLLCKECCSILQYNSTYTKLKCLDCGKEEEFMTIKLRLSKKEERDNIDEQLKKAYQLTEPTKMVKEEDVIKEEVYEDDDDELVSTRFARFAPKKKKRFEYIPEEVQEEKVIDEIPTDVYDDLIGEYMKVVNGKVKIKDKPKEEVKVKKTIDPIRSEIEEMNDDALASEYVFNLFLMDKIDESQYNYYIGCIENGFDDEDEEDYVEDFNNNREKGRIEMDVCVQEEPKICDEKIYDIDDDKSIVFEDDNDPMFSLLKSLQNDDTEELFNRDDVKLVDEVFVQDHISVSEEPLYEPLSEEDIAAAREAMNATSREVNEEEISLSIRPATNNNEVEKSEVGISLKPKTVDKTEEVGLKIINSGKSNDKNKSNNQQKNKKEEGVGLRIKSKDSNKVVDVVNADAEEESVGIKIVQPKKFNDEEIMLKMREIQIQRDEELKQENDYSHYEDEYAYLYEDETDTMSHSHKRQSKNWK